MEARWGVQQVPRVLKWLSQKVEAFIIGKRLLGMKGNHARVDIVSPNINELIAEIFYCFYKLFMVENVLRITGEPTVLKGYKPLAVI